jgi:paraquat-inducible protein B
MPIRHLFLAALMLLLSACIGEALDLNLQLDSSAGLRPGSPVVLGNQIVGQVASVEPDAAGGYVAKLAIQSEFREQATRDARFVVSRDPADSGLRRIELRPGRPDAPPLADGATVRGSIEPEPLFPLGDMLRGFTEGLGALRDQVEHFRSEIQRLPQSEEAKRLQEEWARLREEMKKAQETAEQTMKKDLIPKLQQEMEALEKRFRELEAQPKPRDGMI